MLLRVTRQVLFLLCHSHSVIYELSVKISATQQMYNYQT